MKTDELKNLIKHEIESFVATENERQLQAENEMQLQPGKFLWQKPLVGFADAKGEYIRNLRKIVHPQHQMPEEVLPDAKTIIVYFVPFGEWMPKTNAINKTKEKNSSDIYSDNNYMSAEYNLASPEWAEGYELTNAMFPKLNKHIIDVIHRLGYEADTASEAGIFYRDEVISHWSFRHIAYAAGLGTFGMNNMLITEKGCSGRYNTIVTNLDITPDKPKTEEACLYKRNGSCGLCIRKCPAGALSEDGFDRHKCYEQCLKNAAIYNDFGSSYASDEENYGSEVCGKCIAGMPCTYRIP